MCVCGVAAYASPVNPISIASAMARTTPAVATSVAAAEARPISMPAREGDAARCEEMHRGEEIQGDTGQGGWGNAVGDSSR